MLSVGVFASSVVGLALGHGHMTQPATRSATSVQESGTCAFDRCMWYTNNITIPGPATNLDPKFLTMRVVPNSPDDIYKTHPWRAPGTAPSRSPCGRMGFNHDGVYGIDGRDLARSAPSLRPKWVAGGTAEVAMALTANHGGGYQYRLCASDQDQTEECFQAMPLEFDGNLTWVQIANDEKTRVETAAIRLSQGTIPAGSTWAKNPIPNEPDWPEWKPVGGYAWGHQNIPYNIFDRVKVPASLKPGAYTLSWRWDCEQTAQVWANCADIEVVAADSSSAASQNLRIDSHGNSDSKEHQRRHGAKHVAKTSVPELPKGELVWKWSDANSGISGGSVLLSNNSVGFGTFLSTGSASPGYNRTYWSLDRDTGKTNYYVEVPTAVLYQGAMGDGTHGEDGVLYFGTLGPWVFAVNATTGAVIWRSGGGVPAEYTIPADDFFSAPALFHDSVLIGNYDNHLYSLDAKTGEVRWRWWAGGPCNGSPTLDVDNGIVFFTARFDLLVALNATTGELLWQVRTNTLLASPTYYDGFVLVGTQNSTVDAHNSTTGERVWTISGRVGAVWALNGPPVGPGGIAYFGSDDGYMYGINVPTGDVAWEFETGGQVEAAPVVSNGVVYFGSLDFHIYAVNATTGEGLWMYETGLYVSSVPAVDENGIVYIGSYDGSFYALKAPSTSTTSP